MGDSAARPRPGKLLDLPPELRTHSVAAGSYYGASTDWIRREHLMETSPSQFGSAAGTGGAAPRSRVVAFATPGTVTAASDALFPRDEANQVAASVSMNSAPRSAGASARSGRLVAGDEDEVFHKAGASGFNLLRPAENTVALDTGSAFYADALRGGE